MSLILCTLCAVSTSGRFELTRVAKHFGAVVVALSLSLRASAVVAHPGSGEQLSRLDAQIQATPRDAILYLQRGDVHRADGHWEAARADYDRAARYAPELDIVDYARGELFLDAGQLLAAEICLNRLLARHPDHAKAILARARTRARLGRGGEAAADFTQAIALLKPPKPDYYLERAQALTAAGKDAEALRGLDEGIARFGPLTVLERAALDLERAEGRYDAALGRVDTLAAQSPLHEPWLAERGEILLEAGRREEARAAFETMLASLARRPARRRRTAALQALEQRVRATLAGLDAQPERQRDVPCTDQARE